MTLDNDHGAPVRGADGILYNVSARACVPVLAEEIKARDTDTEFSGKKLTDSRNPAPARQSDGADDHGAGRFVIDPGDHGAGRFVIDPGDHGAGRFVIDPGDLGTAVV